MSRELYGSTCGEHFGFENMRRRNGRESTYTYKAERHIALRPVCGSPLEIVINWDSCMK